MSSPSCMLSHAAAKQRSASRRGETEEEIPTRKHHFFAVERHPSIRPRPGPRMSFPSLHGVVCGVCGAPSCCAQVTRLPSPGQHIRFRHIESLGCVWRR